MKEHASTPEQNLFSCTQIKIHQVFGWIQFARGKEKKNRESGLMRPTGS